MTSFVAPAFGTERERAYAPHCDASVLHFPGACEDCDQYPDWQNYRRVALIAFTNDPQPEGKAPCPSEHFRSAEVRDRWPGNVESSRHT